jgi:hypothetical protein
LPSVAFVPFGLGDFVAFGRFRAVEPVTAEGFVGQNLSGDLPGGLAGLADFHDGQRDGDEGFVVAEIELIVNVHRGVTIGLEFSEFPHGGS